MTIRGATIRNFFGTADPFAADGMGDSPFGMGGIGGMPFMMHGAGGRGMGGMGMNGSSMGGGGREASKPRVSYYILKTGPLANNNIL